MKIRILNFAALAMVATFVAGPANAGFIEGDITMSGDFEPTGGTGLGDATGIDFIGDDFEVDNATEDFADAGIATGDVGFYQDFEFNPLDASAVSPLWSIGGFSFALNSISINFQNSNLLVLSGSGFISAAGFDDTYGTWLLTGNRAGTLFNFSSGSTVSEPGALALVGLGLFALGLRRRRA